MPKASVIIPTYNRGYIVCEAVESVLAQTFDDFEVIVVDDGSTDDTAEKIAAIRDPRVRYIRQPNAGVSSARNHGLAESCGEIISLLDSDDLWKPEKLAREQLFFGEHPEVPAVFSDVEVHLHNGSIIPSIARQSPGMLQFAGNALKKPSVISQRQLYLVLLQDVPIKPTALSLRSAVLSALGGFDTDWKTGEDWELMLRYARRYPIGYLPQRLASLRHSGDSLHLQCEAVKDSVSLLRREMRLVGRRDQEAIQSVRRGLTRAAKYAARDHLRAGHRVRAAVSLLAGCARSRDVGLLPRALLTCLPHSAQDLASRARRFVAGNSVEGTR